MKFNTKRVGCLLVAVGATMTISATTLLVLAETYLKVGP